MPPEYGFTGYLPSSRAYCNDLQSDRQNYHLFSRLRDISQIFLWGEQGYGPQHSLGSALQATGTVDRVGWLFYAAGALPRPDHRGSSLDHAEY